MNDIGSFIVGAPKNGQSQDAEAKRGREREMFVKGSLLISEGKYNDARVLLNVLITVYPESPLLDEAKMLIFYSYGRQGGPKNESAEEVLRKIDELMRTTYALPKGPSMN